MRALCLWFAGLVLAGQIGFLAPRPSLAEDGPSIVVSGLGGGERLLTLDQIKTLGSAELRTSTVWTEGVQVFTGVTGAQFVENLGAGGRTVHAVAANGYTVVIPAAVFATETLLISYARNGQMMTLRDKGPFWVVFPFDANAKFRSDTYRSYAIWSVTRFDFQ